MSTTQQPQAPASEDKAPAHEQRRPGTLAGRIAMAPDFDTLPPDVLAAMEARSE